MPLGNRGSVRKVGGLFAATFFWTDSAYAEVCDKMGNTVIGWPVFYLLWTGFLFAIAAFIGGRAWVWLAASILPGLFALFAYADMTEENKGWRDLVSAGVEEGCLMEPSRAFWLWLVVFVATLIVWAKKKFSGETVS